MPVAKLSTLSVPDAMKSEEGNSSVDTFVRQSTGKDHLLSFSRTGDSPVQWFQLLHALDQPDIPGWPLLTSVKVQMQKCEKCSQEFCSPVNYRRHTRLHRRSLNFDKESRRYRDLLGAYWDKLSLDEVKEVALLDDISLKDILGTDTLITTVYNSLRRSDIWTLPAAYAKAGSTLLEIVQAKPSSLPISSQDLFSILDEASERTFLCAGTAESMQKYIFDAETVKGSKELKTLIACTCFLFEQKLVKAWLAEKEAEALRCQKLLVEEEDAAQRRQAEMLEKKRQKKLRQKGQKAKEQQKYEEKVEVSVTTADSLDNYSLELEETSNPSAPSPSNLSNTVDTSADESSTIEMIHFSNVDTDIEAQDFYNEHFDCSVDTVQCVEPLPFPANTRKQFSHSHWWQVQKSQRVGRNGFFSNRDNHQTLKLESVHSKYGTPKDWGATVHNGKIWTKKVRVENDINTSEGGECEVIIGSISVPVKKGITSHLENNIVSKKHWRPVSRHGGKGRQDKEEDEIPAKVDDETTMPSRNCVQSFGTGNFCKKSSGKVLDDNTHAEGQQFSSSAVKAFLAQRWKEAIAADHVTLVLSHAPELTPEPPNAQFNSPKNGAVGLNGKSATKSEKGIQMKYVLKQKN
ncbi:unnamed protein product [Cuscuta campestris]|uniref:C2H2-type domain-containing protein n=1 Tax=Cuscuta campestris TaxID=132261 RepID=A0A484JY43_9ASTE|nr:unnamed protein product [Cuscuta campestris]